MKIKLLFLSLVLSSFIASHKPQPFHFEQALIDFGYDDVGGSVQNDSKI